MKKKMTAKLLTKKEHNQMLGKHRERLIVSKEEQQADCCCKTIDPKESVRAKLLIKRERTAVADRIKKTVAVNQNLIGTFSEP